MRKYEIDEIDRKIMNLLRNDGRMPIKDIAAQVFLSSPAVSARISNLEKNGYILGYHAVLSPMALGYYVKAFICLEVEPKDKADFYPYIRSKEEVVECNCVTGDYSMLIEGHFHTTDALDQFINEIHKFGKTRTLIVFSTSVEHREVTVKNIEL